MRKVNLRIALAVFLVSFAALGYLTPIGSGGGAVWGAITGTLSAQTDLNTALGLKAPVADPTFTGTTVTIPSGGTLGSTASNGFFVGQVPNSRIQLTGGGYMQVEASVIDRTSDTFYFGAIAGDSIYPFKRGYFGTEGLMVGAANIAIAAPLQKLDVRGNAGASQAQFTNTATGSTANVGALFGIASDGKGTMRLPVTAVPTNATDTCVAGTVAINASFLYYCAATDTWTRVALATWP
jgi:hypothetical protein